MKYLLIFGALAAIAAGRYVGPVALNENQPFKCSTAGAFPHPTDNAKFYYCVPIGSEYLSTLVTCSPGYTFDGPSQQCVTKSAIESRDGDAESVVELATTAAGESTTVATELPSTAVPSTTGAPVITTTIQVSSTGEPVSTTSEPSSTAATQPETTTTQSTTVEPTTEPVSTTNAPSSTEPPEETTTVETTATTEPETTTAQPTTVEPTTEPVSTTNEPSSTESPEETTTSETTTTTELETTTTQPTTVEPTTELVSTTNEPSSTESPEETTTEETTAATEPETTTAQPTTVEPTTEPVSTTGEPSSTESPEETTTSETTTTTEPETTTTQPTTEEPIITTTEEPSSTPEDTTTEEVVTAETTAATETTTEVETTETTEETTTPAPFECTRTGMFPDPTNEKYFYVCIFDGFGYIAISMQCSKGLVFIPDLYRCAAPDTPIPPPAPIECKSVGYYPDPHDCRTYYYCYSNFNGGYLTIKMTCPPKTNFFPKLKICVSNKVYKCKHKNGESTTDGVDVPSQAPEEKPSCNQEHPVFDCPSAGLHPDPQNDRKYYQCQIKNGKIEVAENWCPWGSKFSPFWDKCIDSQCNSYWYWWC
ncbi:cell wall protein DAN4 isoform X2 [Hermetia illucens]|uniref:cell wall protein DAN4 isoform X2 n=1 Tax=Hermetia illucens TaxID=343691 RepID=UPI0018CC7845|nr:cell wall protein DAN4 isoform X2 [Hermetia illucens]